MDNIGFYTMSDERVLQASSTSPMWRTELIITDACNFKCGYCRGMKNPYSQHLSYWDARYIIGQWAKTGLFSIRFSGGEPTLHKDLVRLAAFAKRVGAKRVALSTNGSAKKERYKQLVAAGIDDFSVSLDACCSSFADKMAGTDSSFDTIVENIRYLSSKVYTTVGVVLTEENVDEVVDIISFASSLGVADIRIISAAQYNELLRGVERIPSDLLAKHPILSYRVNNILNGRNVRGLKAADSDNCYLQLDDSVSAAGYYWPCVIYMREGGEPIGKVSSAEEMREQKLDWMFKTNTHKDPICSKNCLDVCVDYNNYFCRNAGR